MKSFAEYRELDEAFKKGDFIKTPTGEIHHVFDVKGNSLETAPYRGKDGYGGGTTVHKTKATKVAKPSDVTEEVELDEDFTKMDTPALKKWINTRERNAMGGNLSKKRGDQYDQAQAEMKKRKANEEVEQIDESDLHAQFAAFAASRGGKMTTLADRKKATDDLIAKREKEAAARPKAEPQKTTPYKPLGGRDEVSGRSYSEEIEGVAEVSQSTLKSYTKQAKRDVKSVDDAGIYNDTDLEILRRREKGLDTAKNKLKKLKQQGVAEGLPQTLRKVVPGYAKREIDKKMDAGKFGKTDADKDANFQRYKKIQDKLKEQGVAEESEMGDLAHEKTMKHRFLVTYSDPNHTSISMRKEKQQKHVLVPSTKDGNTIYKGEAEPLVKKYMNKQGYKVHDIEHVGMVTKKAN